MFAEYNGVILRSAFLNAKARSQKGALTFGLRQATLLPFHVEEPRMRRLRPSAHMLFELPGMRKGKREAFTLIESLVACPPPCGAKLWALQPGMGDEF